MVGATVSVVGAFLFRFLTVEFTNDHFVHLSRGWQILQGDVPIRDFFDPGLILQYYASAAALLWSGHNLLGEALLTTGFIAAGAGLTFVAAARLSRSVLIASAATFLAVVSTPRLYGYPKVFFYALAIVGAWQYAQRPGRRSLIALAVITAVAFLFRHDHGVYIGLSFAVLMTVLHWERPRQAMTAFAQYALVTLALLAPFLVFVQITTGLTRYIGGISPQLRRVSTFQINSLPVTIDASAPWLTVSPAPERLVNIRWTAELSEDARRDLERRHGLTRPEHVEDSTWSYVLADEGREPIRALIEDPAVADTHGIDRGRRQLDINEPLYVRLQRWIPVFRMQIAPGILTRENALAWFYYVTLLLPILGVGLLLTLLARGQIERREAAVAGMAIALTLITVQTLVRGSPDSRLGDVASATFVVAAWVTARSLSRPAGHTGAGRASRVLLLLFWILTTWSVGADAQWIASLNASRIHTGPAGIWWRMGVVTERLRARPIDYWAVDDPGIPGLMRYVYECTAPTDRLFVTWFAPQIFFYAERAFAGGQVYLTANWHASPADQELTIERLDRQRVPIVLERADREYEVRFPAVYKYVQSRYANAPMSAEGMKGFRVLVDRNITPTRTYEPLGLPCYR